MVGDASGCPDHMEKLAAHRYNGGVFMEFLGKMGPLMHEGTPDRHDTHPGARPPPTTAIPCGHVHAHAAIGVTLLILPMVRDAPHSQPAPPPLGELGWPSSLDGR